MICRSTLPPTSLRFIRFNWKKRQSPIDGGVLFLFYFIPTLLPNRFCLGVLILVCSTSCCRKIPACRPPAIIARKHIPSSTHFVFTVWEVINPTTTFIQQRRPNMSPLEAYHSFLLSNLSAVQTIESSISNITWLLPGRFEDAEVASEGCKCPHFITITGS